MSKKTTGPTKTTSKAKQGATKAAVNLKDMKPKKDAKGAGTIAGAFPKKLEF